jgi:tetratricopeptide (TPR) repeat protein
MLAALVTPITGPALAQTQAEKKAAISQMLDALKAAPTEDMAGTIDSRLRRLQLEAGTPAVTLLMSRGLRDLAAAQFDEAIIAFTDAIILDADLAEAWHQRAVARHRSGDTPGALRDLSEALRREPRSYAVFRTLTDIATAREDWKSALAAWEKLMDLAPKLPGAGDRLRELRRKVYGQDA